MSDLSSFINISANTVNSGNDITTQSNVSATGNVTAANFITTGSQGNIYGANVISGVTLTATGNVYGDNVVGTYLYGCGANITGLTICAGSEISKGTSNVNIPVTDGPIIMAVGGLSVANITCSSIAIGRCAGFLNQGCQAVAVGPGAGSVCQGPESVAVGRCAGLSGQGGAGGRAVAIGCSAARNRQSTLAVAIGTYAGGCNQGENAIAVGYAAGRFCQANNTIILNATGVAVNGTPFQPCSFYVAPIRSVCAAGNASLYYCTTTKEITSGPAGGSSNYGNANVETLLSSGTVTTDILTTGNVSATGNINAGNFLVLTNIGPLDPLASPAPSLNGFDSINSLNVSAAGNVYGSLVEAATLRTTASTIALGAYAGNVGQLNGAVAIGVNAGNVCQNYNTVAIGTCAGATNQKYCSVAIGSYAAQTSQGGCAVAVGWVAGQVNQHNYGVAIGGQAGQTCQGNSAVAIGWLAGQCYQSPRAIAIGCSAGQHCQGLCAVAIGPGAGKCHQASNTIIINATGTPVNGNLAQSNSFYVAPIRSVCSAGNAALYYCTTSKEITSGPAGGGSNYGNANVESLLSSGTVTTDILTTGNVSATGNITAANFITTGTQGNIYGANVISSVTLTATGNVYGSNIVASYLWGDGSNISNINANSIIGAYGNSNVEALLSSGAITTDIITTANISAANFTTSGSGGDITGANVISGITLTATGNVYGVDVVASYLHGDGSNINNINANSIIGAYGNSNVEALLSSGTVTTDILTTGNVSAGGNITANNFTTIGSGGNIYGANVISGITLTASGNVYANNISTSGSQGNITGANVISGVTLTATGNVYGDNFVGTYLYGCGSNITGISGGNGISNGTSNISIATANSAITMAVNGCFVANISYCSVAIGLCAGATNRGSQTVAIGFTAGAANQSCCAVAVGTGAGEVSQGRQSLALGYYAGHQCQANNTIILNASPVALNGIPCQPCSFYVSPIRSCSASANVLYYCTSSKEITYGPMGGSSYGNANVETLLSSGTVTTDIITTANINGGNINAGSLIFTTGNVSAIGGVNTPNVSITKSFVFTGLSGNANIDNSANFSTTGNVLAQNFFSNGVVSAGGNVRGSNINTVGLVSAQGNVYGANVIGSYLYGDGSNITGGYGNANVTTLLSSGTVSTDIRTTGNIYGNISGNVYDIGGRGVLYISPPCTVTLQSLYCTSTGLTLGSGAILTSAGCTSISSTSANVLILTNCYTWLFDQTNTFSGNGTISTSGNIYGGYLHGCGANITGIIVSPGNNIVCGSSNIVVSGSAITFNVCGGNVGYLGASSFDGRIIFGAGAGTSSVCNFNSIAIGIQAGQVNQCGDAVAIGAYAGRCTQGCSALAIGGYAGYCHQGTNAIAIGLDAGRTHQGNSAIAIGFNAGYNNQADNSIILNATGGPINSPAASTFTVAPIRNAVGPNPLFYCVSSREITYATGGPTILTTLSTVSTLPSASTAGLRAFISDSNLVASGNFGAVATTGGSNIVPVFSDGTNWRIG